MNLAISVYVIYHVINIIWRTRRIQRDFERDAENKHEVGCRITEKVSLFQTV